MSRVERVTYTCTRVAISTKKFVFTIYVYIGNLNFLECFVIRNLEKKNVYVLQQSVRVIKKILIILFRIRCNRSKMSCIF